MSRPLLVLNVALVALALAAAAFVVREMTESMPKPTPVRARAGVQPRGPSPAAEPPAARPSASAYGVVASRNLFSPTRTEVAATTATRAVATLPKPLLYGVVLRDGTPIAYLEDPLTKRVAGYRLGDAVAGGTVQAIEADRVVLTRPEGPVDVRLRDPGKPRPALLQSAPGVPPGTVPIAPGAAAIPAQPAVPFLPQFSTIQPPPVQQPVIQQPVIQPGQIPTPAAPPVRRSLPPSLLRRVPPGSPNDAAPQN